MSETQTMTLHEFLMTRFNEDASLAREAEDSGDRPWVSAKSGETATMRFLGAFDPARVLADVEAKRRLVKFARVQIKTADDYEPEGPFPAERQHGMALAMEYALAYLALPYADHPDFREEWRT